MDAFAKIDALPPLREMPAAVMQSNKPWMRPWDPKELETENGVTFAEWQASENLLAAALGTELVTATDSGHAIYAFFPPLVIDAIKEVVEAVRSGAARVPQ
jgi:hypothetical protein